MTGSREPLPELTTTHIGGGRSAIVVAVLIVAALVGFVAINVAGRPAPPDAAVALPATTTAPTASAGPRSPGQPTPPSLATIAQIRPDESAARPYQYLGTVLTVAGQGFIAELEQVEPGRYYAAYRIPFPRLGREASLELADIQATASHDSWTSLGRWQISLDPIVPETRQAAKVLDEIQLPRFEPGGSALKRSGFSIKVFAEGRISFGLLTIEIERGTERPYPNESYAVDARVGDFATRVELAAIAPGHYSGLLIIPDRVSADELSLALVAMPASNPLLGMVTVYQFRIAMPPHGRFNTGDGIRQTSDPQAAPGTPQLLTFGHEFQAQTAYSGFQRAVVLDLQMFGGVDPSGGDAGFADMSISWPPDRTREADLLVYRDFPLRKDKHDLIALYHSFIDLQR